MKTTSAIVILLLYYGLECAAECNCTGVLLQGSDQLHCWEVMKAGTNAWSMADTLCSANGGRLGFLASDVYHSLVQYLKSVYSKPIFVATVVGSVNPARYANMCPANNYTNTNSTFDATSVEQCGYIVSPAYQIEFLACESEAYVLCDIPLEKVDVCGMDSLPNTCTVTTKPTTVSENKGTTPLNVTGTTRTTPANATLSTVTTRKPDVSNHTVHVPVVTTAAPRERTTVSTKNPQTPCVCPTCPTVNTPNNATTCPVSPKKCCEKDHWRLPWISKCIPWVFFFLLLCAALLVPPVFLCLCHCCCDVGTRFCQIEQKFEPENGIKPHSGFIAEVPVKHMYDEEKTNILPPQPIDSIPAVIPDKIDTPPMVGFGLISREVQIIHPDKPVMKDAGVNTDPWEPRRSKKKFVPKRRFPSPEAYIIGVDDPAEEVNIEVIRSPSPNMSVGPKGDVQPPIVFMRNRAPEMPSGLPEEPAHEPTHVPVTRSPKRFASPPMMKSGHPATVINLTGKRSPTSDTEESKTNETAQLGPRKANNNFPSPPTKKKNLTEPENVPEVQVDPATPRVPAKTPNRFPSPPRSRSQEPPVKKPSLPTVQPPRERRQSRSPQRPTEEPENSSYGTPARASTPASTGGGGMMQPPTISLKAPKGKLGGAVRAGGNGADVPPGWKPWSKGAKGTDNGHFLNND